MRRNVEIALAAAVAMMPFAAPAFGTSLITAASGDGVPNLNVQPSCKGDGFLIKLNVESCLSTEKAARDQLSENWAKYSASDKNHCLSLVSAGASPSYVEVLTCLEMSCDATIFAQTPRCSPRSAQPIKSRRH